MIILIKKNYNLINLFKKKNKLNNKIKNMVSVKINFEIFIHNITQYFLLHSCLYKY